MSVSTSWNIKMDITHRENQIDWLLKIMYLFKCLMILPQNYEWNISQELNFFF